MTINPLTVEEALKSASPPIAILSMADDKKAKAILILLVTDLIKFFNVGKTMDEVQIGQTINLILSDTNLKNLKPEDFKLCFGRIKKGYYGKLYDRLDGQIIIANLLEYFNERMLESEEMNINQHKKYKNEDTTAVNLGGREKVINIMKQALKEADQKMPLSSIMVSEIKIKPSESEHNKFIQKCFNEFYLEWQKNPHYPKQITKIEGLITNSKIDGRFILLKDIPVNETEYVELKLKELNANSHKE